MMTDLTSQISELNVQLAQAKADLEKWREAGQALTLSAAKARAENQSTGRGLGGMLLGPKYRAAARRAAAASNAEIARDVAAKRAQIADGKRYAQERVRQIQARISEAKQALRAEKSASRKSPPSTSGSGRGHRGASEKLKLLKQLKELHEAGLLTDDEFEEKRRKFVEEL